MVREDLVESAVSFLQDTSVASAPLEQKLSFLRAKNLTPEEIDASLARVGQAPSQSPSNYSSQFRQPPPPQQYGGYQQQQAYWGQPPPETPRRDWRDWFIMATVVGGVGYSMYWTAKRYIYPIIAPPTPPQLEQDKASIDASFEKAFALLEQLATDTQELKDSEQERKQRMDRALAEVEGVIGKMKEANETRELEAKRIARELEDIKEQIPQAIQREKETTEGRLKDLATEMKSLKTLVSNRIGGGGGSSGAAAPTRTTPSFSSHASNGINGTAQPSETNGSTNAAIEDVGEKQPPASVLPERPASQPPYAAGRTLGGKAQIPSWQLAAKKKAEDAKNETAATNGSASPTRPTTGESGTVVDAMSDA